MASVLAAWSTWHIVLLVAVILLLFGGSKLPELARGLARGLRIFRDEMHGVKSNIDAAKSDIETPDKSPLPPAEPTQTKDDDAPKA
ncbi:MAG: twin-arginine translocase TatA/TatE family subunit [Phycisphaerae bacterium]|nr:twin-arginine translocase TatA/TatE family subunit [Phycisphaerae bacterium]